MKINVKRERKNKGVQKKLLVFLIGFAVGAVFIKVIWELAEDGFIFSNKNVVERENAARVAFTQHITGKGWQLAPNAVLRCVADDDEYTEVDCNTHVIKAPGAMAVDYNANCNHETLVCVEDTRTWYDLD